MNWFDILKAELVEPIVDVSTGKSPTEECCDKTIDYMKSKGTDSIGFWRLRDPNGPREGDNIEHISKDLENIDCDYIYEWIETLSRIQPGSTIPDPKNEKYWRARSEKFKDYLKYWDACVAEKGTEGMEQ